MTKTMCVAIALLATVAVACSSDDDGGKTIGPSGGEISLANGATLDIPAGAVTSDVDIHADKIDDLAAAGIAAVPEFAVDAPLYVVKLTPHGTTFDTPVTLTIPYDGDGSDLVVVRLDDEQDTTWEAVGPVTHDAQTISVQLNRFSILALIRAGSCPCFNGAQLAAHRTRATQRYIKAIYTNQAAVNGTNSADSTVAGAVVFGSATCSAWAHNTTFADWWPHATVNASHGQFDYFSVQPLPASNGCHALITAYGNGDSAAQVGYYATGLMSDSVTIDGPGGVVDISVNDIPVFARELVTVGSGYASTIMTQPSDVSCQLSMNASGTATTDDNIAVQVTCSAATGCDDSLAGMWDTDITDPTVVTIAGTKASFSFNVPGGNVTGTVNSDDTITATLTTDSARPSLAGSVYTCAGGSETMLMRFQLDTVLEFTLTAQ